MKKALLIIGIVLIVAAVLSLSFSLLNRYVYYHMLDGSTEHYAALRHRMTVFFAVGAAAAVIGVGCIIVRVII